MLNQNLMELSKVGLNPTTIALARTGKIGAFPLFLGFSAALRIFAIIKNRKNDENSLYKGLRLLQTSSLEIITLITMPQFFLLASIFVAVISSIP